MTDQESGWAMPKDEKAAIKTDEQIFYEKHANDLTHKEFIGTAVIGADLFFKTASALIGKMASKDGDEIIDNLALTAVKTYKALHNTKCFSSEQAFELTKAVLPQFMQQPK